MGSRSVITWLGIVWDGVQGVTSIAESQLQKCLAYIYGALLDSKFSARVLASLVGQLFLWALS